MKDRFRINQRVRAREVRLIDEHGAQVGIVSIGEALRMADERDLDLVEVAPNASPPVCRLMDYGKFRYEQSKKEREARKNQKQIELKEVRLRPKTDDHDLEVKARHARRFLLAGDKVKFTLRFRGREMAHTDIGRDQLDQIIEQLRDIAIVEQKPQMESRALFLVLAPNAKVLKAAQQSHKEQTRREREQSKQARQVTDGQNTKGKRSAQQEAAALPSKASDDTEADSIEDEDIMTVDETDLEAHDIDDFDDEADDDIDDEADDDLDEVDLPDKPADTLNQPQDTRQQAQKTQRKPRR
ncbi:MAG: translation initiation factor IF-3 [Chloroflexaceae bacterium]|nr:translation initiation factor IF-3 [Chloroflexaceae bacterium]